MSTRTVTDADGTWLETLDDAGRVRSRQLRQESTSFEASREATRTTAEATKTADGTRAAQVAAMLAKLDARTATNNEIQATLAAIIRYIGSHVPR